jgi:membrane-bound lytic murein transglycosylase A
MGTAERSAPSPQGRDEPSPNARPITAARLRQVGFGELEGWGADDLAAAFRAFRAGASHTLDRRPELRPAQAPDEGLLAACRAALADAPRSGAEARAFFERWFAPWEVLPHKEAPFFTGYFEPEVEGSLARSQAFPCPILARPADLVTLPQGEILAGSDVPLSSVRRQVDGRLLAYPDRAAIDKGALAGQGLELVWLRDRVEVFIIQVQGSARVRLADGNAIRLRYAGRNGWPYTSIGRLLIEKGAVAAEAMSLEALTGWLRANPEDAQALMRRNASYVFFAIDEALGPDDGPIGGAGLSLTRSRSIAIDRSLWPYGLPFWIDVDRPEPEGRFGRWQRLVIGQDTGAAIVGPGRVDVFFGSGAAAGALAGRQRHHGRAFVLLPPRLVPPWAATP